MNRAKRKLKYFGRVFIIKALVPFEFIDKAFWPFSYYRINRDSITTPKPEIKRDWKLKPKNVVEDEVRLAESIKQAVIIGANIKASEYAAIKENKNLHTYLLAEIYSLTYNLTLTEEYFCPIKEISREFGEALAIKAKAMSVEPYSLVTDVSRETPELYNPKRFDFNWTILAAGWEKERREYDKAMAEMKSKTRLRTK